MQKYLFKEMFEDEVNTKLSYYLICDGERLGVEVSTSKGDSETCIIEDREENAFEFLNVLANGKVWPVHIQDILKDRKTERFLDKLSQNLIQAYLETTFDSR